MTGISTSSWAPWEGQDPFVYRNEGGGVFTREAAPLNVPVRGNTLSWGDYDGDGFLDAFLGIYSGSYPGGRNSLLHGNGNGTFTVVTNQPMCLAITEKKPPRGLTMTMMGIWTYWRCVPSHLRANSIATTGTVSLPWLRHCPTPSAEPGPTSTTTAISIWSSGVDSK